MKTKMTALVIDDDSLNVALFSQITQSVGGIDAVGFTDPVAALAWCREGDPDLVLVDYRMPQMDGLKFIESFRALSGKSAVPLIMATSDDDREIRYKALELSANDFVSKPVDRAEIRARITNMLALRRGQLQMQDRADWLAEEVEKATQEIKLREREVIFRLSRASEYRDPETGAHIQRMASYARLIAAGLGMPQREQELVFDAAPMHDIGKMGIPDNILLKPGRLDEDEMRVMRQHTVLGAKILSGSSSLLLRVASEIALSHHEKFDGSGYPYGSSGKDISQYGRIVAVADVFDALTSARPYKPKWEIERAAEWIRNESGRHFDPECVEVFFRDWDAVLDIYRTHQG